MTTESSENAATATALSCINVSGHVKFKVKKNAEVL